MAAFAPTETSRLRRLILVRHAAAAPAQGSDDRARPLTTEGRRAVATLASRLGALGSPDAILCSPARRTRETLEILAHALGWTAPPMLEDGLYPGDYLALLQRLRTLDAALDSVLLVGHNPGIAELAARLGGNAPELRAFRPGAVAIFETAEPWSGLGKDGARLLAFYTP